MSEDRPVVFTVTRITSNFGGLFSIKTKDSRVGGMCYTDVGVMQLFSTMQEICEDINNNDKLAVLFEVD